MDHDLSFADKVFIAMLSVCPALGFFADLYRPKLGTLFFFGLFGLAFIWRPSFLSNSSKTQWLLRGYGIVLLLSGIFVTYRDWHLN